MRERLSGRTRRGAVALGLAISLLMIVTSGCGEEEAVANLLPLPEVTSIARIMPKTANRAGPPISDSQRFAEVLETLESLNAGWKPVADSDQITPRSIMYTAEVSAEDESLLLVLWVGANWIAAYNMETRGTVRQRFTGPEREALLTALTFEKHEVLVPKSAGF